MGWFDEQIKARRDNDRRSFEGGLLELSDAVTGKRDAAAFLDGEVRSRNAIMEILKYYRVAPREIPHTIRDFDGQLDFLLRPNGIAARRVNLEEGWYRDAVGPYLCFRKSDGTAVAMLPSGFSGYRYTDSESGGSLRVNAANARKFEREALCFYRPFPLKKLNIADLMKYVVSTMSRADYALYALAVLVVTLIGMVTPRLQNILFSTVIDAGSMRLLVSMGSFLVCAAISQQLLAAVKQLLLTRMKTRMSVYVEAAAMMRVLSLPADFFKQYSAGELFSRTGYISSLCSMLVESVFATGLTSVFSLVYISQIFAFAPALVVPSLAVIAATVAFSVVSSLLQMRVSRRQMELAAKESGLGYALISGIRKIRLSGAERRAFAKWAGLHAESTRTSCNPPAVIKYNAALTMLISSVGQIVMYYMAVKSGIAVADYYSFNTAYGMVSGAFASLAGIALTAAGIKPVLDMALPILKAEPEVSEGRQLVTRLAGGIELCSVSFRYRESMPYVLENLSLKIEPGQYVAIVGPTGCGKSTFMRLLLGFEKPQRGAVYYDGRDIATLDLKSLRKNIGVVMQDGRLFSGDIFSNITVSAPQLTLDETWEAAEIAGIADDIRAMPMGMNTLISEGSGGISGGQRQRLMIARAVAPKPKILMFDEATSALDNLTQRKVSEALDGMKCTRIVIAHRLSTIRQCDRILYLEKGHIAEDGTYEELIALNGKFAALVERQRLDVAPREGRG